MLLEQDTSKAPTLLAQRIKPSNYQLSILNVEFGGQWKYDGKAVIDAEAFVTTNTVILHSEDLEILSTEVKSGLDYSLVQDASSIVLNEDDKQVCLQFSEAISKGHFQLLVSFRGQCDPDMTGFYRSRYEPHEDLDAASVKVGSDCYMLATHFEPCDARRAFPCFDEPHLKATFELELEIPEDLTALSNMPEKSCRSLDGPKKGLKTVSFEKSPVMSTYLLAWAVGDFEYVEALTTRTYSAGKIPVRIYTTKGLVQHAQFALKDACDTLDLFSESFGVEYPLPKCDHLVVHDFISGAMENWGLITYKPTKILFDPVTADNRLMSKASYVVAHELAHQWFGNLVTMSGWNELWLNEGFATWAGYFAVDRLHPDWNIWGQFVDEAMEEAFALDSLDASHPIEVNFATESQARQMFDSISYCKGSSVIRMLASYLGEGIFLKGIAAYLESRLYGNATSDDLWRALSQTSGLDVGELMDSWIHRAGFPLVNVVPTLDCIELSQTPFLREATSDKTATWHVPLGLNAQKPNDDCKRLCTKSKQLKMPNLVSKINHGHTGFYRTHYPSEYLLSILWAPSKLSSEDKVGIIADMRALVFAGSRPAGDLLTILPAFKKDRDCFVWSQVKKAVSLVMSGVSGDSQAVAAVKAYTQQLLSEVKAEISWTGKTDSYVDGEFEKNIIQLCVVADDEEVLGQVKNRFQEWKNGGAHSINRNLQSPIFGISVAIGGEREYLDVKAEYIRNQSIDGREICIAAMGRTKITAMARDFLDFTFMSEDHIPLQNIHFVAIALANGPCSSVLWEYVKENWDTVYKRLSVNGVALNLFIESGLCCFDDLDVESDIAEFFAARNVPGIEHPLQVVSDNIKMNAAYKARAASEIRPWLQANGLF
ncbi:uncharacterized protein PV06_10241 [Exophiala oligosperma]|uniref:Aminopeptidase n=1 Tax=Exophiala oligosperma TaxID=215243 RepID=A0A0D2D2R0_9EURO|nr:uncharacterized protein PV06_10241 [Exophiala oligosperma]KIW37598.1 hypothetical protein PV06_10241 [Exophiala oligosperma]